MALFTALSVFLACSIKGRKLCFKFGLLLVKLSTEAINDDNVLPASSKEEPDSFCFVFLICFLYDSIASSWVMINSLRDRYSSLSTKSCLFVASIMFGLPSLVISTKPIISRVLTLSKMFIQRRLSMPSTSRFLSSSPWLSANGVVIIPSLYILIPSI